MRPLILAAALAAAALAAPAAPARDLTVVSWGGAYQDAQREVYFRPFMQSKGTRLLEETWDGGVGVLRAKMQSGANNWDLVQVESEELEVGCEEGLFERIDWARVGGREAYRPDAVHDCGVGTIYYSFILAYDRARITGEGPRSWADFWDVQRFPGKRGLRRGPKTNLEIALMSDGVPPNQVYAALRTDAGVDRAFARLDALRPHLVWWTAGAQPPQLLASGEVAMTSAYNGRISAANKTDNRNFGIVWTNSLYTIDSWVIMKGSPNAEAAYAFLAFAGQPQLQAQLPPRIPYGVPAVGADALIPAEVKPDLPTTAENIATAVQIDDAFWLENIDRLTQRFNAWAAR
jgi:putative spermidine/putrescine transport system substrate-binding protein